MEWKLCHLVHVSLVALERRRSWIFLTISTRNTFTLLDKVLRRPTLYCVVRKEGGKGLKMSTTAGPQKKEGKMRIRAFPVSFELKLATVWY